MGLEVIVSEEDFVATYPNGAMNYLDYTSALALKAQGENGHQIAKKIGRPVMTIHQWLARKKTPHCVIGLERAKAQGYAPLTTDSAALLPFGRLYSWALWSGSVARDFQVMISESDARLQMLGSYFKERLGLESAIRRYEGNRVALTMGTGGKIAGRMLYAMGFPTEGRKREHELVVPDFIRSSTELRSDFLRVLVEARACQDSYTSYKISLIESDLEEGAKRFGDSVLGLFQLAFPRAGLSDADLRVRKLARRGKDTYTSSIQLSKSTILNFIQYYPCVFSVRPTEVSYDISSQVS